jgi:thiaminase
MDKKPNRDWADLYQRQDAQRWGAQNAKAFDPLVQEELARLPRAFFPVYAHPITHISA